MPMKSEVSLRRQTMSGSSYRTKCRGSQPCLSPSFSWCKWSSTRASVRCWRGNIGSAGQFLSACDGITLQEMSSQRTSRYWGHSRLRYRPHWTPQCFRVPRLWALLQNRLKPKVDRSRSPPRNLGRHPTCMLPWYFDTAAPLTSHQRGGWKPPTRMTPPTSVYVIT